MCFCFLLCFDFGILLALTANFLNSHHFVFPSVFTGMEPLSPPEDDQDVDSSVRSTPTEPGVHQGDSPKICTPRRAARFQDAWLKRFWFLRYSETLNQMWCHVCRLNADQSSRKSALIKGSRVFHITNIKKHGTSTYHKDNVERYMQLASELKLGDISNISADMTG